MSRECSSSMEDYLEAIAVLGESGKAVRVSRIGQRLKVRMPSVTAALKKLSREGLVEHRRYGYVRLTAEGGRIAREVLYRHRTLTRFLAEALDVDASTAEEDACRIEHVISPLSLERVIKFIEFIGASPQKGAGFPRQYRYYLEHGKLPGECYEKRVKKQKKGRG